MDRMKQVRFFWRVLPLFFIVHSIIILLSADPSFAVNFSRHNTQNLDVGEIVDWNESKKAWSEFVAERRRCQFDLNPELCYHKAWLKLQKKISGLSGVDEVPGFKAPPWLQPILDIIEMEEKKIRDFCDPLEKHFKPVYQAMINEEKKCDLAKSLKLRNQIVLGLGACPNTYTFKAAVNYSYVIRDRERDFLNVIPRYNYLINSADEAISKCRNWENNLSYAEKNIIEDCSKVWNEELEKKGKEVNETLKQHQKEKTHAEIAIKGGQAALNTCRDLDTAISELNTVNSYTTLKRCAEGLYNQAANTLYELGEFKKKHEVFKKDASQVLGNAERAHYYCINLEKAGTDLQALMGSTMYAKCSNYELREKASKIFSNIENLRRDLYTRDQRIQQILKDADWAVNRCDWKSLEQNQSRAMSALPAGYCLANNKYFLDLKDKIDHGLLEKKRRRLNEIKPTRDGINGRILGAEGSLRKVQLEGPYREELWNKNVIANYQNHLFEIKQYVEHSRIEGYELCLQDLIERANKLPAQIQIPSSRQMPTRQQAEQRFDKPVLGGVRLDWCLTWAKDCGQPAADEYCRKQHYSRAVKWGTERVQQTRLISNLECEVGKNSPICDAFTYIICK